MADTGLLTLWRRGMGQVLPYLIAVVAAFAVVGVVIALLGANVLDAYRTLLFTAFRSPNSFVQMLLQALALTVPLAAGQMNFVFFSLIDYVATEIWRDPAVGHPTVGDMIGEQEEAPRAASAYPSLAGRKGAHWYSLARQRLHQCLCLT